MHEEKQKWLDAMGSIPKSCNYGKATLINSFLFEDFHGEIYVQENGCGTNQRVIMLFPTEMQKPAPAIAVPFYFPEAMLGSDPISGETLDTSRGIEMMLHLTQRGYVTISAEAFHLTYIKSEKSRGDFTRWQDAADELKRDHPEYTGIGKLFYDTELLIDMLCADSRVDSARIGIAGHSLGGKMAFYTGCLDDRIGAILASDFGIGWNQTNWQDDWYWGGKLEHLISKDMDHAELLSVASAKPFCLIAGKYDDEISKNVMLQASGYDAEDDRLLFVNHATGHRPPMWALEKGYDFLDKWVKNKS